ncbi:MAG: Homoserine kinase, partial [uncultured Quadrisphaera sp.]
WCPAAPCAWWCPAPARTSARATTRSGSRSTSPTRSWSRRWPRVRPPPWRWRGRARAPCRAGRTTWSSARCARPCAPPAWPTPTSPGCAWSAATGCPTGGAWARRPQPSSPGSPRPARCSTSRWAPSGRSTWPPRS